MVITTNHELSELQGLHRAFVQLNDSHVVEQGLVYPPFPFRLPPNKMMHIPSVSNSNSNSSSSQAQELLAKGVHPTVVSDAFSKAVTKANEVRGKRKQGRKVGRIGGRGAGRQWQLPTR